MEKNYFNKLNIFYPTIKLNAESFKETMIFLDANIRLICQTYQDAPIFRSKLLSFLSLQEKNTLPSNSNAQQTFFLTMKVLMKAATIKKDVQWKNDKEANIKNRRKFHGRSSRKRKSRNFRG